MLHKAHNEFRTGLRELSFDFDTFASQFTRFLNYQVQVGGGYLKLVETADLVAQYAIKHSSTRRATLKYIAVRLIEQWENLMEYLLVFFTKTEKF